jgi:pimeloyl-ACP methyl ester carboxylesterase
VDQTVEAMTALGDGAVVIGASLGGLLGLLAMQRASAMTSAGVPAALVLINPLPPMPWAAQLPASTLQLEAALMPWHSQGRFDSTQRALPKAGFADQHLAFRHWRDESAALLREAYAGVLSTPPSCPVLIIASDEDTAVPPQVSAVMAEAWGASLLRVSGGHIDPVMGHTAASTASATLAWLRAQPK